MWRVDHIAAHLKQNIFLTVPIEIFLTIPAKV